MEVAVVAFNAGQASAQPSIEAHEAEIENLEGFLVLSDDAVRAKTEKHAALEARVKELEARVNTLAAHADPSIAPDKTSPL